MTEDVKAGFQSMATNIQLADPDASAASGEPIWFYVDPVEQGTMPVSETHDGGRAVYLVAPTIIILGQSLAEGHTPKVALARWKNAINVLLHVQRDAGKRVCILSEVAVRADPAAASTVIKACIGGVPDKPYSEVVPQGQLAPAPDLIAALVLAADPEAVRLEEELQAAMLTWPGMKQWARHIDIDELYERYHDELHALEIRSEGEALLKARNQEIEQSREELARALIVTETRLADAEAELQRVRDAYDEVADRVARMESSRSWRITAPLRRINRLRG